MPNHNSPAAICRECEEERGAGKEGASRYRIGMRRVALRQPELLIFFFGVKRLLFGAEMKMFAPARLYPGVEMLMLSVDMLYFTGETLYFTGETLYFTGETLYFTSETLYSAGEMLHATGGWLMLGNEMLYLVTVQLLSWCERS